MIICKDIVKRLINIVMNEYLIVKSAIRYKYYIGKDMLRGKDEFYYNQIATVTGTEWVKI